MTDRDTATPTETPAKDEGSDSSGGVPDAALPMGGAGVATAGGYLAYRRLSGATEEDSGEQ